MSRCQVTLSVLHASGQRGFIRRPFRSYNAGYLDGSRGMLQGDAVLPLWEASFVCGLRACGLRYAVVYTSIFGVFVFAGTQRALRPNRSRLTRVFLPSRF
jgi:hypothetical protein